VAKRILTCPNCMGKLAAPEGAERFRCPTCKSVLGSPPGGGNIAVAVDATTTTEATREEPQAPSPAAPEPSAPPESPAPVRPMQIPPRASAETPAASATGPAVRPMQISSQEPVAGEPALGETLAGYTLVRRIGQGSMGTVFEAIQEGLKRRVALKVLPETVAKNAIFFAGFKREAQAVAKLNHPNIVQIFDIDEDKNHHFFSMEYVDGESLADLLARKKRLPVSEAVPIIAQTAAALDFAYEHLLVHRNLKPSNILLTEQGDVKVADLGLAKSFEGTSVGIVRGAHGGPLYMAPEFSKNPRLADCRSDIYALGAVLFHLLTGRPPFPGPSVPEMIIQHADMPFPSAHALVPEIPKGLDGLLAKMCAKDPADRFQTYAELLERLQALLSGTDIRVPSVATDAPTGVVRRRRNWLPLAVGGAVAAMAVLGLFVFLLPKLFGSRPQASASAPAEPAKTQPAPKTLPAKAPASKPTPAVVPKPTPPEPEPPRPTVEEPKQKEPAAEPKAEEPKAKEEPVEPKEEPKKEEPRKEDGPPAGGLAEVTRAAQALAAQNQFGKALAALDGLTKDNADEALQKAVDAAKAPILEQAAKAFQAVAKTVRELAAAGKLDEARAALQTVADTFGTDNEVGQARVAIEAIDAHKEALAALTQGAEAARKAAEAADRRAAQQGDLAKGLEAAQALLEDWRLDAALESLGKLKAEDPALAAQIEQRKAAIEALAALRDLIADHIRKAEPRLTKGALKISGLNGELTGADKEGITSVVTGGGAREGEKIPWSKLGEVTVERLAKLVAKAGDPAHQLALGLWFRLLGNEQKAAVAFGRADELGTKTDALTDPAQGVGKAAKEALAARTFAGTLKLFLDGKLKEAEAALADYKEKFADTAFYAENEKVCDVASAFKPFVPPGVPEPTPEPAPKQPEPKQPEPKQPAPKQPDKPGDEQKAKECYDKAMAAFNARLFEECKKQLAALRDASPNSPLLTNRQLNPSVETMQKAVDARGPVLKVSATAKGAHASVEKAVAALEAPRSTIEIDGGVYSHGSIAIPNRIGEGLILRGLGERPPRLDGGVKRDTILVFDKDDKDVWIENLEFSNTKAAVDIGINCSATLQNCVAVTNVVSALSKHAVARVTLVGCIFRLEKLVDTPTHHSLLLLGDKAEVSGGEHTASILVGNELTLSRVTLTDCLIIGSCVFEGDVKLNHATVVGPISVYEDARNITITDSILGAFTVTEPKNKQKAKDQKKEIVAALTNVCLYAQPRALPKDLVKAEEVIGHRGAPFEDPSGPDYRLPKNSPLREKGTDKSELGSRFPEEMLGLLRSVVKRSPALLRPPARHR